MQNIDLINLPLSRVLVSPRLALSGASGRSDEQVNAFEKATDVFFFEPALLASDILMLGLMGLVSALTLRDVDNSVVCTLIRPSDLLLITSTNNNVLITRIEHALTVLKTSVLHGVQGSDR